MSKKSQVVKYKKNPQAPRRFKSAYMFFSTEKHKSIRQEKAEKLQTTDVAKMVSQAWKDLPPEEREVWEEMARRDKARYEMEKTIYTGPWKVPATKTRAQKDPNAPKRPMSAFLSYSNSKRAAVKAQHPEVGNAEVSKILSQMWKDAPEEERKLHIEKEYKLRQQYKSAIAIWRQNADQEQQEARKRRENFALQQIQSPLTGGSHQEQEQEQQLNHERAGDDDDDDDEEQGVSVLEPPVQLLGKMITASNSASEAATAPSMYSMAHQGFEMGLNNYTNANNMSAAGASHHMLQYGQYGMGAGAMVGAGAACFGSMGEPPGMGMSPAFPCGMMPSVGDYTDPFPRDYQYNAMPPQNGFEPGYDSGNMNPGMFGMYHDGYHFCPQPSFQPVAVAALPDAAACWGGHPMMYGAAQSVPRSTEAQEPTRSSHTGYG